MQFCGLLRGCKRVTIFSPLRESLPKGREALSSQQEARLPGAIHIQQVSFLTSLSRRPKLRRASAEHDGCWYRLPPSNFLRPSESRNHCHFKTYERLVGAKGPVVGGGFLSDEVGTAQKNARKIS